ncbi:MAG TPA: DNA translocase FtsK 4TM domain-containing protein, partial [Saprospiraceae bacterium]|nr:DNA translocase FtsK 4TM domain-containing protein [Saprospiraceae bacterium]
MSIFVRKNKKPAPATKSRTKKGAEKTSILKDQRLPKLIGLTLTVLGVFTLVASISYVFTWKEDQDKILNNPFSALGEGELQVANWLGRLGAVTGNGLIYWGFGISALVLPVLIIGFGLRKFVGAGLQTWYPRAAKSILAMVYLSMFFAFVFSWADFPWGGAFGESTTVWLKAFMGFFGVLMSLLFVLAATIVVQFNPTIQWKGEFLAFPKFKMPAWKMSWAELGLDFFKKKKPTIDAGAEPVLTEQENIPLDEDEDDIDDALQPGFLNRFLEENQELAEVEEDDDDLEDLDLDTHPRHQTGQPASDEDFEIEGLRDPGEIAEDFSEGHIPPTFSGVEDKVFLMNQENQDHSEPYDPTLDLSSYRSPDLELLLDYPDEKVQIDRAEVEANKDQIIETLLNYKIEIT